MQKIQNNKTILIKKNKIVGIIVSNFKTYHKEAIQQCSPSIKTDIQSTE